ncbi:blastula protease 10-like [Palaemon carinicauda]|uniref:blastula protease 10-like n=1 Tax=Palaemon carinicauda TaxID=392227 RepID=UPI0035B664E5
MKFLYIICVILMHLLYRPQVTDGQALLTNNTTTNTPSTQQPSDGLSVPNDIGTTPTQRPSTQDLANDTGTNAPSTTEPPDSESFANVTNISVSSTQQPNGEDLANNTVTVASSIQQPSTTLPAEHEPWRKSTYKKPNWEWKDLNFIVTIKVPDQEDTLKKNLLYVTSQWTLGTCILFILSPEHDRPDLVFRRAAECTADYGTPISSRVIHVNDSCISEQHLSHYLGHYLGLIDEQRRPDRDEYIQLVRTDLSPLEQKLMTKFSNPDASLYNTEYDFSSIMHIAPRSIDEGSKAIFRTKDPRFRGIPGRDFNPSHRDYFRVNSIHGCQERLQERCGVPAGTCKNGGFLTPWCICECSPGTEGDNCETQKGGYYDAFVSTCQQVVTENGTLIRSQIDGNPSETAWCLFEIKAPKHHLIEIVFEFKEPPEKVKATARCQGSLLSITEVKSEEISEAVICGEDFKRLQIYWSTTSEVEIFYDIRNTTGHREFAATVTFREVESHPPILPDPPVQVTFRIPTGEEATESDTATDILSDADSEGYIATLPGASASSASATTRVPSTEASAIKDASKTGRAAASVGSILICFFIVELYLGL